LLYYVAVFLQIHLEAKRYKLEGLPAHELPPLWPALKPAWVIFPPIVAVVYFLWQGYGLGRVALYGIFIMLACALISRGKARLTTHSILNACYEAADMSVIAGMACATAGIIIGTFFTSGLGDTLSLAIIDLAGGSVWPAVFLTAIVCIILGMGVPTPAIYITMVIITIPALIKLGVVPIAAHMFTFFMGVASGLTPPVCMTAYVAGTVAGAPMMRTGVTAFRLSIVGFIVAFLFIARPELLMIGPGSVIMYRLIVALVGVVALSIGIEGYLAGNLPWTARSCFLAASVACWWPFQTMVNLTGVVGTLGLLAVYGGIYRKMFAIVSSIPRLRNRL
jgi:TRAP transporter 4TM/12TM fusion protein